MPRMNGRDDPVLGPILLFVQRYKTLVIAVVSLSAIPPLLALILNIGPPWPHRKGVSCFTSVALWVVLLWSYSQWHDIAQYKLKRIIRYALPVLLLAFVLYVTLTASTVYSTPIEGYSVVGGVLCPEYRELKASEPGLSVNDLLAGAEFDAMEVFHPWSVVLARVGLLTFWLALYASLSVITSTFILLQEKRAKSAPGRGSSGVGK